MEEKLSQDRVSQMSGVQSEALTLFRKKNADYGDAFANFGPVGVIVRMGDKISRLCSITTKKVSLIDTESLRDTLIDLHNYSAMAIMLLDEEKNGKNTKSDKSIKPGKSIKPINTHLEVVKNMESQKSPEYKWFIERLGKNALSETNLSSTF
jgi:hypothetical protein